MRLLVAYKRKDYNGERKYTYCRLKLKCSLFHNTNNYVVGIYTMVVHIQKYIELKKQIDYDSNNFLHPKI